AVEDVEKPVSIRMQEEFPILAGESGVHQNDRRGRIPVVDIVRGELVMPFQSAACRVEGQEAIRVQVITAAFAIVRIGIWISGGPEERIGFGIVRAREPGSAAAERE